MKKILILFFFIVLSRDAFCQFNYAILRNDTLMINKKIEIVSKMFENISLCEAVSYSNDIYLWCMNSSAESKIIAVNVVDKTVNILSDSLHGTVYLLKKNGINIYLNNGKSGLTLLRNRKKKIIHIDSDRLYSVSPDNKHVVFSNGRNYENLFNYDFGTKQTDTMYCFNYSDFQNLSETKYYYVGITSEIHWLDNKTICYGGGDNGLIIFDTNSKNKSNYFSGYRFEGNITRNNNKLLLINRLTGENEYGICLVNIDKKQIKQLLRTDSTILDVYWIDKNNFAYVFNKGGVYSINTYNIANDEIKELIHVRDKLESMCIIK
jgi:hypothetical protein